MRTSILFITMASIALAGCGEPLVAINPSPEAADSSFVDDGLLFEAPAPAPDDADTADTGDELYVSAADAQETAWTLYPDLDFGEDVMFGTEEVNGEDVPAYMVSATDGFDVVEVLMDARTGDFLKEVRLEDFAAPGASACTISAISGGTKYSQRDARWASTLLGTSTTDTIGAYGCVLTDMAMMYTDKWAHTLTPADLNTWAKSAGCFSGSSLNIDCAADRYSVHSVSSVSMSNLATEICAGNPILFKRVLSTGSTHYVLGYYYSGGSTSSTSSYKVADPWTGTLVTLYGTASSTNPYRKWN